MIPNLTSWISGNKNSERPPAPPLFPNLTNHFNPLQAPFVSPPPDPSKGNLSKLFVNLPSSSPQPEAPKPTPHRNFWDIDFKNFSSSLGIGVATAGSVVVMDNLWLKHAPKSLFSDQAGPRQYEQSISNTLKKNGVSRLKMLDLCALRPLLEESVFRGLIRDNERAAHNYQETPLQKMERIAANSGLFAAIHFNPFMSLKSNALALPPIFLAGVAYNLATEVTDSIAAPTTAHMLNNYMAFKGLPKK